LPFTFSKKVPRKALVCAKNVVVYLSSSEDPNVPARTMLWSSRRSETVVLCDWLGSPVDALGVGKETTIAIIRTTARTAKTATTTTTTAAAATTTTTTTAATAATAALRTYRRRPVAGCTRPGRE
jgi:hypothetical protein